MKTQIKNKIKIIKMIHSKNKTIKKEIIHRNSQIIKKSMIKNLSMIKNMIRTINNNNKISRDQDQMKSQ
jgi:hypothetical protein